MTSSLKICLTIFIMALVTGCGSFEWFPSTDSSDSTSAEIIALRSNAGPDQSVFVGDAVTLDGSSSTPSTGSTLTSYTWQFTTPTVGAPSLNLTDPVRPTFTTNVAGDYVISLVVKEGEISSAADSVTVTVKPFITVAAYAGEDQDVALNKAVILNGSGSTDKRGAPDVNGDKLKYSWNLYSKPNGTGSVTLDPATSTSAHPTFTPTVPGIYKISLQVNDLTDLTGEGSTDEVIVRCNLGAITVTW